MTPQERNYAKLQERKDTAEARFANAITSIKDLINSSLKEAEDFFSVAGEDGARDVLMSGSAIASANENHLLSRLTPEESVQVFQVIGALSSGSTLPVGTPQKLILLGQLIVIGHQLSSLSEAPHSVRSNFDLQVQPDGSVIPADLPLTDEEVPEDETPEGNLPEGVTE